MRETEEQVRKQNGFSRTLYNEAKLGAYYTDVDHARRIGRLLEWPDGEVLVLEPSVGNGEAVLAATEGCEGRKVYGVELNAETYEKDLRNHSEIYAIHADFLTGVKISNQCFSFCFANPPYGVAPDSGERLERLFVEKLYPYLARQGILALVVPYSTFLEEKFFKSFFRRFNPLCVFRFDDDEYEKYHQIVVIAQKRTVIGFMNQWLDAFYPTVDSLDKISYLPKMEELIDTKIPVPVSTDEKLVYFTTLEFHADEAAKNLRNSKLYGVLGDRGFPKQYEALALGSPAVPLSKDTSYLMAMCGAGQGLAGSEETGDLHLQRGVVKVITDHEIKSLPDGGEELTETTHSKIVLVTVENNGAITTLE